MVASTILLRAPLVFQLPSTDSVSSAFENCLLTWEQDVLLITLRASGSSVEIPALKNELWLRDCLQQSPIGKVYLDPNMEESLLKAWADICEATGKQAYLKVPSIAAMPQVQKPVSWRFKRLADWLVAAFLLLSFSPLLFVLGIWLRLDSPGPALFRQWRVGPQGKLFRIYKLRSMYVDAEARHHEVMGNQAGLHKLEHDPRVTRLGRWLRKLSLDELPQLFNVLRGEMSLVGPRPWAVYDAVRIEPALQSRLNAMPGITGAWQVEGRSNILDLSTVNRQDLDYVKRWTLWGDLNILLLTVPKVLFGTGAY